MIYFKFNFKSFSQDSASKQEKESFLGRFFSKLFHRLEANPDFEEAIDFVTEWLIEYDDVEFHQAVREIGFDINKNLIVKLPDERNYGYWSDLDCGINFFKKFNYQLITKKEFDSLWNSTHYDRELKKFVPINDVNGQ
ncbi:hypothetical protein [Hoylesella saccharolytica]|uniref:hypothetical protein n=1 Tax=Hoylesella saccharolytica TaxID=633701 RepID=UPI0028E57587|nr:hypothetical protein [Hoylesella saccharolytica]